MTTSGTGALITTRLGAGCVDSRLLKRSTIRSLARTNKTAQHFIDIIRRNWFFNRANEELFLFGLFRSIVFIIHYLHHCRLSAGDVAALTDDRYTVRLAAMRPALLASIPNHSATSSFHCRFGRPRLRLPSTRPSITIRSKQSCRFKCPKYFSFCLLMNRNNTPDVTPSSFAIDSFVRCSVQLTARIVL